MLVGYCRLKKKRRSTITDLLRMTDTGGVHMEEYRLCNSDYRFMTLVWEHGPGLVRGNWSDCAQSIWDWNKPLPIRDQAVESEGQF